MFNILFLSFLSVLFHLSIGKIFSKYLSIENNNLYELSLTSLIGLISLSFISLLSNFFFPLDQFTNTIIFLLLIITSITTNHNLFRRLISKKYLKFIFISTISIFLIIFLGNIYNPDGGMYHFPYINILNENKIILGISNLHHRYGHTSIMQYLSAVHFNYIFGLNGIIIPLASLAIYSIVLFLSYIKIKNDLSISNIFAILIVFFICWKMNRYSGYGNDAPAHFIFFAIILIYLDQIGKFSEVKESAFYLISLFAIFSFLNKTFLIFAFLIPLISFNKKIFKNLINVKFLFLSLFLFLWILKNILTTGCMIFPMPLTCFDLSWTNLNGISNVYEVSIGSEAWSKDWSNQKDIVLPYKDYLKNFYWINFWLDNHFKKILSIIIPYIVMIFVFVVSLKIMKKKKVRLKKLSFKKYLPIITIISIGLVTWFLKAPIFRYGYSYLVSIIALIFALVINYKIINFEIFNQKKISVVIIFIAVIALSLKQFSRIYKDYNSTYFNKPWPEYFSYSIENKKIRLEKILINDKFFYYIPKNNYCYYSKSPCTSVEVDKNLKKKTNIFQYKIYYF